MTASALLIALCLPSISSRLSPLSVESQDDRDLEALGQVVGSARIVQLGETTHGDGTGFLLRSRIIKYLHEEKGFDVLVWESSILESEAMNKRMAGPEPVEKAAHSALFSHWSGAVECQGLFSYVRSTHRTSRPLWMSGFDIQSSGVRGAAMILDLVDPLREVSGLKGAEAVFREADRLGALPRGGELEAAARAFAAPFRAFVMANRQAIRRALGKGKEGEIVHLSGSLDQNRLMMESVARHNQKPSFETFREGYNLRERANAENLLWLANVRHRGKKLIVWAHNVHISHRGADGTTPLRASDAQGLDSTGRLVKRALGRSLYSIGVVAGGGSWRWLNNGPITFAAPSAGSLESELLKSPYASGFLNLSRLPKNDPLRKPMRGFISRQQGEEAQPVWPDVFDGLLYLREMKPRTPLEEAAKGE